MRQTGLSPAPPVVVCSRHSSLETTDECYRLGANAYFVKPDDHDDHPRIARSLSTVRGAVALPSS